MAKKAKAAKFKNERLVLVGDVIRDPGTQKMAAEFAASSQDLIDCLQLMRDKLEGKFEEYSDDGGRTVRKRWNPPEYFNCCSFSCLARKIYEAWYVARRVNKELEAFDGATVWALVVAFGQMRMEQMNPSGAPIPVELPALVYKFECEIGRFEMLLSITQKKSWEPTEKQIQKVKNVIAGMTFKTTNLDAIQKAARMNRQRLSIILKMIEHKVE